MEINPITNTMSYLDNEASYLKRKLLLKFLKSHKKITMMM